MNSLADFEDFLRSLHPQCANGGCKLPEARRLLAAAEQLAGNTIGGEPVSQALWCDEGDHSFSARDPRSERWERKVRNPEGKRVTIPWDVCGKCIEKMNVSSSARVLQAADTEELDDRD